MDSDTLIQEALKSKARGLNALRTMTDGVRGASVFGDGRRLHWDTSKNRSAIVHSSGKISRPDRFGRIPDFLEPYFVAALGDRKRHGRKTGFTSAHMDSHNSILSGGGMDLSPELWNGSVETTIAAAGTAGTKRAKRK